MSPTYKSILALCLLAVGCSSGEAPPVDKPDTKPIEPAAELKSSDALHNVLPLTDDIYTGGEPHGDAAFAQLSRAGIKTIVSVDGARPNLDAAKKHGLRYIHIPIGYDGIDEKAGQMLARVVKEADGPFYVHCHHGRHRGPAAAAVMCIAAGAMDGKGGVKVLERAKTNKDYSGLWHDVENYQVPAADAKLPELVEAAVVGSVAAGMAQIDRAYDNLKLCRDANWATPPDHPDLVPAQEALLIQEALYESGRTLSEDYDDQFKTSLQQAEGLAQNLHAALKTGDKSQSTNLFKSLEASCKRCHKKYRN
jgi:protein tyrosine phosphatase (PTP) superfamily phosphohydrolase (DUF442 family)